MAIGKADEAGLAVKFAVMRPFLDERAWRVYLGTEANALGYGGIAAVARASGASETMVPGRIRPAAPVRPAGSTRVACPKDALPSGNGRL